MYQIRTYQIPITKQFDYPLAGPEERRMAARYIRRIHEDETHEIHTCGTDGCAGTNGGHVIRAP